MNATRSVGRQLALRFPTTFAVAAPYVLLFLPTAVWYGNPETDFIIRTSALAIAGAFAVEAAVASIAVAERRSGRPVATSPRNPSPRVPSPSAWHPERLAVLARIVSVVAIAATLASVVLGAGTLRSQVDGELPSGAAAVLTPFTSWTAVALALLITARHTGGLSRAGALRWIGALLLTQIVSASVTTITARAVGFLVLLAVLAYLTELVPRSWIVAAIGLVAVVWPTVFAVRNQLRLANGIDVSTDLTASDRLRFDEQIGRAADLGPGHELGQPGFGEVIRYGLVPRFLDPDRGALSSGNLINEYLGGAPFSSYTFLPVATVWFFWGAFAVVLLYAGYAAFVMTLRPWSGIARRPYALILFTLALNGPLSWFGTPPDSTIGALQALVATLPVFVALQVWARRSPVRGYLPTRATPTSTVRQS
ncbi:hypothetical protein [Curtobacterium sp. MCBA15_004]|uniref:hypothetical protein n=1 Tax=unclassified Curtobacterium TaxID=257496 RepID=UPI0008DCB029|nr:hypothetical protein [Curtobacterium sp. MCBA15_004]WIA97338.1 hypothetical protein QOL16_02790 [Curtobacterium sp. MCBA15_004]